MAHSPACACTECTAKRPVAGQMLPSAVLRDRLTQDVDLVLAEPVVSLGGGLMEPPPGTEAAMVAGWVELDMPNHTTGARMPAIVVLCDDGRSRAIWYDFETGQMRSAVALVA